jgi:peptidoglycan hydrolase-like protein with peptidoglycan-binding domain
MKSRNVLSALLSATVMLAPAQRAMADADGLVGGIVGGIIGGAIVNEATRHRQRTVVVRQSVPRGPSISSAQREENRQVQTALNYFGFPAGTPDGVMGRNSRNAVAQYQGTMGYPPTGELTLVERDHLLTSYQRALAGGTFRPDQVAQYGSMGTRGLLLAFRDQNLGIAPAPVQQAAAVQVVPAEPETVVVAAAPQTAPEIAPVPEAAPVVEAAATGGALLPNFAGTPEAVSMASHCNEVNLVTSTNGGFTTVANLTDPGVVLSEQFCLARTYAITEGETLAKSIQGLTMAEMQVQCEGFAPAMRDLIAGVSLKDPATMASEATQFALGAGIPPAQLATTAKICLSVGYRTDNADVALGSNLLLVGLGDAVYGEMLGHHLTQGFGTTQRDDLARGWYETAIVALEGGAKAAFAPGQADRPALLRAAALGQVPSLPQPVPVSADAEPQRTFKLPAFKAQP